MTKFGIDKNNMFSFWDVSLIFIHVLLLLLWEHVLLLFLFIYDMVILFDAVGRRQILSVVLHWSLHCC